MNDLDETNLMDFDDDNINLNTNNFYDEDVDNLEQFLNS